MSDRLGKLSSHLTWGIFVGVLWLLLFAKLVEDLLFQELRQFDSLVTSVVQNFTSPIMTKIAIIITNVGSAWTEISLFLIVGGYLFFRRKFVREIVILFSSLAGGWLLNEALKAIFHRARPDIQHLVEVGGYSFPSGHAMVSMTFYGMLGYLFWFHLRRKNRPSWYVAVLTSLLIFFIGISRIYLGVHFPSDVIAGFSAGGVWLTANIIGFHKISSLRQG
ncbi:phosphatase PAP2 family protein [Microaerobacter geothermalis]|uniref:phosphatase PAP2 family protein n=1 Tax=Microaerobacter geothermalis TaxID=674972 RepID=UPI001F1D5F1E|nr:phosphatase PAP2 family protein [Microaerobacter geothermalis]MCF6093030.1 phosphatase PAP2 family protein [Microaerobacter geothermalis]